MPVVHLAQVAEVAETLGFRATSPQAAVMAAAKVAASGNVQPSPVSIEGEPDAMHIVLPGEEPGTATAARAETANRLAAPPVMFGAEYDV